MVFSVYAARGGIEIGAGDGVTVGGGVFVTSTNDGEAAGTAQEARRRQNMSWITRRMIFGIRS